MDMISIPRSLLTRLVASDDHEYAGYDSLSDETCCFYCCVYEPYANKATVTVDAAGFSHDADCPVRIAQELLGATASCPA